MSLPLREQPVFCITADADWASEYCVRDFADLMKKHQIRPTIFATNENRALREALQRGDLDVGLHPNFCPGTTHGADPNDTEGVIDHIQRLFPEAETFRAHRFVDSTPIAVAMRKRGMRYDSNLCCYLQPGLIPLRHAFGSMRFPVFWEDDVHWTNQPGDWDSRAYFDHFFTPGLKVVNVHPFMIAANCSSAEHYESIRRFIPSLDEQSLGEARWQGPGARTFLLEVIREAQARGHRFYSLKELFAMYLEELGDVFPNLLRRPARPQQWNRQPSGLGRQVRRNGPERDRLE